MKRFDVEGHMPSFLPEGNWKLVWADEFDGTELDKTKWDFRLNFWGERFEAYTDQGVVLDGNSHVELHRTEIDGRYVSPQLQTGENSFDVPRKQQDFWPLGELKAPKFVHRYGYYECRCKFQKYPETMWSAFWMQSPAIGTRNEPEWCGIEADIMEGFSVGKCTTGNIMGGYGSQCHEEGRVCYDLKETEDGFHYFGMDWSEDGYVFYCDGEEVSRCNGHVSHVPEFLLLTTEVVGYRASNAKDPAPYLTNGKFEDDAFIVDFVRVFDRIG